ncbi:AAA family ATPase [Metallibacterium sp.]|uniref:ATP-dependent nuclease n=1 Tax=Metallibacterium sp. TaxID=2940281 RepID=UPI002628146E|nr:AAA family ATPase [Metallibacterium sp.]
MKLTSVRIRMFRNILDSTEVKIEEKVTCLVGKNESGKSAFLNALWRLKPARSKPEFDIHVHYPAWLEKRHRIEGVNQKESKPVEVWLEWEPADVKVMEEKFGPGVVVAGSKLHLWKNYENNCCWESGCDEKQAVANFVGGHSLPAADAAAYAALIDFEALKRKLTDDVEKSKEAANDLKLFSNAQAALRALLGKKESFDDAAWHLADGRLPEFFYFADYSKLPYSVKIQDVLKNDNLSDSDATARALLMLGGTETDYILNPDYERRKRELENVANVLTDDVNKYWSQNPELRVQPDIAQRTVQHPQGQQSVLDEMKLRIWDNRHSLSLPFTDHSAGFQWFFSFLAAFSEYENRDPPVVILLDEPAVGLHAKAQADFLRFIEERLTKRCQVIYTTHSPFMVQPGRLDRVRLVEDRGKQEGAVLSSDVLTRDRDTLFPLQGALGYDLVQHLFVAENNVVVEGTSDYAYLKLISDYLASKGRTSLDPKWSIVPVGGADLIPTFVALLGNHLKVTVLVDSRKEGNQRLERMARDGYLEKQRIILVGEVIGRRTGDIEDMFEEDEYLGLYNKAFGKSLEAKDLKGNDPIVARIARHESVDRYDHGRPADVLLRERETALSELSEDTLKRFEDLFRRINKTLC